MIHSCELSLHLPCLETYFSPGRICSSSTHPDAASMSTYLGFSSGSSGTWLTLTSEKLFELCLQFDGLMKVRAWGNWVRNIVDSLSPVSRHPDGLDSRRIFELADRWSRSRQRVMCRRSLQFVSPYLLVNHTTYFGPSTRCPEWSSCSIFGIWCLAACFWLCPLGQHS